VSCAISPGELVGVVGPSGSGKTTLLRLITGLLRPGAGAVRVGGAGVRTRKAARRVGYVSQVDSVDWDFPLTVEHAILLGLTASSRRTPWFSRAERARARMLCERLGLAGLERRHIRELSGGQQQRLFLARAMIRDCDIILLDEPTSGVDLHTRREVLGLLGELNADGLTVVLTTHDLNWVAAHLPRIVCLNRTIIADGTPDDVFTPEVIGRTYGARVRIVREAGTLLVADDSPVFDRDLTETTQWGER
jgi:zinc/manganese transport system ATP-binding protein